MRLRALGAVLASVGLCVTLAACEPTDPKELALYNLKNPDKRQQALIWLQRPENKADAKEAVPMLIDLVGKEFKPMNTMIRALGLIGDPLAVPALSQKLEKYYKLDSPEADRRTEELAVALGRIGDSQALPKLVDIVADKKSGEQGRSGAIRAIGMMAPRGPQADKAVEALAALVRDEKENITNRHYAMKALASIASDKGREVYAFAMFVDNGQGLNLFRDAKAAFATLADEATVQLLTDTFLLKNKEVTDYADALKLDKIWVRVKSLDIMGTIRHPKALEFLLKAIYDEKFAKENYKDFKGDIPAEAFLKGVQAIERIGRAEAVGPTLEWIKKKNKTKELDLLPWVEAATNSLRTSGNPAAASEVLWAQFKAGDVSVEVSKGKTVQSAQLCWSAANTISSVAGADAIEQFRKIMDEGKCKGMVDDVRKIMAGDLLPQFLARLEKVRDCGGDAQCYATAAKDTKLHWSVRDRALRELGKLKPANLIDILVAALGDLDDQVRFAAVDVVAKLELTRPQFDQLHDFWAKDKNLTYQSNLALQKATEELGYVLAGWIRRLNIIERMDDEGDSSGGEGEGAAPAKP